jgi:hypothetical protein
MMGDCGICTASKEESWVTDDSWCPKKANRGELQIAR